MTDTRAWHFRHRFWCVQVGWHVYRHRSPVSRDSRWVFQPFLIIDLPSRPTP